MRKVSYLIGLIEAISLAVFAISVYFTAVQVDSKVGSPLIETIIYLIFSTLMYLTANGVKKNNSWARTPFMLIQIFIGIAAYTLLSGTAAGYKFAGVVVGLMALAGFVAILKTPIETN